MTIQQPSQYQKGWTEFYKLKFHLTRDVLIPRPETELLVDEVLSLCHSRFSRGSMDSRLRGNDNITILDIGTGSGCIAISIAKNAPHVKILATDISEKALAVAKMNAKLQKMSDRTFFVKADLYESIQTAPDIIVTNLPYIPSARLLYIDPMVSEWEPRIALDGGSDGFDLYRKLFSQIAEKKLFPKYLIAEIDYTQGEFALQEALKYFPNAKVEIKKDLAKNDRILIINFTDPETLPILQ